MPSIKFESNGGSSYDNECSYRDAAMVRRSFNDVRLHELATPILIIALQLNITLIGINSRWAEIPNAA
jgi:hypothetical protein